MIYKFSRLPRISWTDILDIWISAERKKYHLQVEIINPLPHIVVFLVGELTKNICYRFKSKISAYTKLRQSSRNDRLDVMQMSCYCQCNKREILLVASGIWVFYALWSASYFTEHIGGYGDILSLAAFAKIVLQIYKHYRQ